MKLNRIELKKIIYEFNSISNRLLRVHYDEYKHVLERFLEYINLTEIIKKFVDDCGHPSIDVEGDCTQVAISYGRYIFDLGASDQEEVSNVFAVLTFLLNSNISIRALGQAYDRSAKKYQDGVKAFNERVVMVLIRHIEGYLTKIGIDMGVDETVNYNISVVNGQVNVAHDKAIINATINSNFNHDELAKLINDVRAAMNKELPAEEKESVNDSLELVESELNKEKPRKGVIQLALNALKAIKSTAEFSAAVAVLIQFVSAAI